jgi:hypothetical protein
MRILVCAWDFPYPPRGGGRADIWRRIEAFLSLGHEVMLINLYDPDGPRVPTVEALAHVDSVLAGRYSFAIRRSRGRTVTQLLNMGRIPWHVATRVPDPQQRTEIEAAVRGFAPDVTWLDGPWFGELGLHLREQLGVPIVYRSHNVEHVYLQRQAGAARRRRDRIGWRVACVGLERYQLKLMAAASVVFDISLQDLDWWRARGVTTNRWLPPLPELAVSAPSPERVRTDILFVGGLRTPNNVQGVRWLVERVLPLVRAQRPDVVVGVVGAYPAPDLKAELEDVPGVRTYYDVPDTSPYQLKMLDMLMTDAPIVTRSQGLAGLPDDWAEHVDLADTEGDFAAALLRNLEEPTVDLQARAAMRRQFDVDAIRGALAQISGEDRSAGIR